MKKKDSVKTKYEALVLSMDNLKRTMIGYGDKLRSRRSIPAFFYLKTEQPPAVHGLADGPKQFNIVQIQELINHVMTANQLGYETLLTATPDKLDITFREKLPSFPYLIY